MANDELRRLREFVGPDGVLYLMSAHTKLIGANIRIHFLAAESTRSALVGYIGPHLATSSI
jgi:hypothetical protein